MSTFVGPASVTVPPTALLDADAAAARATLWGALAPPAEGGAPHADYAVLWSTLAAMFGADPVLHGVVHFVASGTLTGGEFADELLMHATLTRLAIPADVLNLRADTPAQPRAWLRAHSAGVRAWVKSVTTATAAAATEEMVRPTSMEVCFDGLLSHGQKARLVRAGLCTDLLAALRADISAAAGADTV